MAVIKSGVSTDQLTIDPTSKAARVSIYNVAGAAIGAAAGAPVHVLPGTGRTLVGRYAAVSFRTLGLASAPHNLFTIWNPAVSGRSLAILRLVLEVDHTTLLATNLTTATTHPIAQPVAGTALVPSKLDAAYAAAVALPLGATASDGGAATAITATAGTPRIWENFVQRAPTLAGWFTLDPQNMLPSMSEDTPLIIAAGDGVLVQTVSAATTGAHYVIKCLWEEFTP